MNCRRFTCGCPLQIAELSGASKDAPRAVSSPVELVQTLSCWLVDQLQMIAEPVDGSTDDAETTVLDIDVDGDVDVFDGSGGLSTSMPWSTSLLMALDMTELVLSEWPASGSSGRV